MALNEALQLATWALTPQSILKLEHTLGRFLADIRSLRLVVKTYNPFPNFLSILSAFGRNGSEECCNWSCHRRGEYGAEICYNVRYPALHGRKQPGPPWSMRHMAVYQNIDAKSRSSHHIFVQPAEVAKQRLEKALSQDLLLEANPVLPHVVILQAAEAGWEAYLRYLGDQCYETVSVEEKRKENKKKKIVTISDQTA